MDLLLVKDVEKVGTEGTIVQVKPGFARNYLLPFGLAVPATPQQMKAAEAGKQQRARKAQRAQAGAAAVKQQVEGRSVTLKLTLGEGDKPFGSVTAHDIVEALAQEGIQVEKHAVQLEQPIKTLGVYPIPIRLHPDVTATLKLWVVKA